MGVNTGIDSSGHLLAIHPIMSRKSCRLHAPPVLSRRGAEPLPRNVLVTKVIPPKDRFVASGQGWAQNVSPMTIRFIGTAEVLGAIGLLLPAVTHLAPVLVPSAAVGLVLLIAGVTVTHAELKELPYIAANLLLMALAFIVAWAGFGPTRSGLRRRTEQSNHIAAANDRTSGRPPTQKGKRMRELNPGDIAEFNNRVIAEFRTNGGRVDSYGLGTNLVLIRSLGARSGVERVTPVVSLRDGHSRLVAAGAGGSPTNPAWYYNLLAHPDITIETPEGSEQVTAVELHGDEYDAAWRIFDAVSPDLAHLQQQAAPRRIPIIRLVRGSAHEND
jgi:deazaflavin-dependent oxidoreductase (nitroreductase family)